MRRLSVALALITLGLCPAVWAEEVKPDPNLGRILQTVDGFNHPESCTLSLDGKYLYVTNCASSADGLQLGRGAISVLEVQGDGTLKMLKADFTTGLNGPLGITVLPKATKKFRAGTLLVCTGYNWMVDDKGKRVQDVKRLNPGVTAVDPESGEVIGHIPMGPGSAAAQNLLHATIQPNGLCFDNETNLYVADGGGGGDDLEPPVRGRPGIKRIKHASIDAYSDNKPQGELTFVNVRHIPNGVYYSKTDDAVYWTTSGGGSPAGGAIYRIPRKDFPQQSSINVAAGDLNPLEGLCITPNGGLVVSRMHDGDIAFVTKRQLGVLRFVGQDDAFRLSLPGDIKLNTLPNGNNILYVPEQEMDAKEPWKQRLRVVLLPSRL